VFFLGAVVAGQLAQPQFLTGGGLVEKRSGRWDDVGGGGAAGLNGLNDLLEVSGRWPP
jgi:hypothetical protein